MKTYCDQQLMLASRHGTYLSIATIVWWLPDVASGSLKFLANYILNWEIQELVGRRPAPNWDSPIYRLCGTEAENFVSILHFWQLIMAPKQCFITGIINAFNDGALIDLFVYKTWYYLYWREGNCWYLCIINKRRITKKGAVVDYLFIYESYIDDVIDT